MNIVYLVINAYAFVVLARLILTWIPIAPSSAVAPVVRAIHIVTEPPLSAIRAVVPPISLGAGAVDLSATIFLLALWLLAAFVGRLV